MEPVTENLPDLIGFELKEALEILSQMSYNVHEVIVTKPAFATEPVGEARIVRLSRCEGNGLQVIVAYEDYLKGGAKEDGI